MSITGTSEKKTGRIRLGMVGGGQGAFIGAVHRLAARMDDHYEFVAGALSSDAARSKASGEELGLAPDRIYGDFREMAKAEAKRKDGIEAVSIVTPNHMHFPAAKAFIEAGIHVICDKPLGISLKEAKSLEALLAKKKNIVFAFTHNYSAYPMIRQAKDMVASGSDRMQGGKRVLDFQGNQFMLADLACELALAERWIDHVADLIDGGETDFGMDASVAKLRASDLAMRMATECVQVHGGYGYCRDYRAERLMRDAKITQIWEGTNQVHRQLIGRSFIRK